MKGRLLLAFALILPTSAALLACATGVDESELHPRLDSGKPKPSETGSPSPDTGSAEDTGAPSEDAPDTAESDSGSPSTSADTGSADSSPADTAPEVDAVVLSPGWNAMTPSSLSARRSLSAIWSGTEMMVFGGYGPSCTGGYCDDGARYSVLTDTWTALPPFPALGGRVEHTAVWSGTQMIVFGGVNEKGYLGNGKRYDLATDAGNDLNASGPSAGKAHVAGWTGTEIIVGEGVGAHG